MWTCINAKLYLVNGHILHRYNPEGDRFGNLYACHRYRCRSVTYTVGYSSTPRQGRYMIFRMTRILVSTSLTHLAIQSILSMIQLGLCNGRSARIESNSQESSDVSRSGAIGQSMDSILVYTSTAIVLVPGIVSNNNCTYCTATTHDTCVSSQIWTVLFWTLTLSQTQAFTT